MISLVISLAFHTLGLLMVNCDAAVRQKRILYGQPLYGRDGEYSAVLYYAWISNGRECEFLIFSNDPYDRDAWRISYPHWFGCRPHPAYLTCGGAFIALKVVATACHCIARYEKPSQKPTPEYSLGRPVVYNHWERRAYVYFGANQVAAMRHGIPSVGFVAHQRCNRVYNYNKSITTVYDFGWIMLESSPLDAPVEYLPTFDFAPLYSTDELAAVWHNAVQKEAVCLYMGFGRFEFLQGWEPQGETIPRTSPILRHGWNINMNYVDCKGATEYRTDRRDIYDYTRDAAHSCGRPFGTHKTRFGNGDSGSPVTCNNFLLGVVSSGRFTYAWGVISNYTMLTMDNVFSPFENARHYRRSFMAFLWAQTKPPDDVRTFKPVKFYEIPPIPFSDIPSTSPAVHLSQYISSLWLLFILSQINL